VDGLTPDCEKDGGCLIPPLMPGPARALEIRDKLQRLSGLNIGSSVLDLYRASIDDLDLIAIAEDELREEQPHGPRSEMAAEC